VKKKKKTRTPALACKRFFIANFLANFLSYSPEVLVAFPNTVPIPFSMSFYSTCLVVLVVYVPYWILVGTLRHPALNKNKKN
jgi:hypothetical protein